MKATILVDNYVQNKHELQGEPSFSCLLEDGGLRILFDVGYSSLPFRNARKMGIDLGTVDFIVLSHGHLDHTWGLGGYIKYYKPAKSAALVMHPDALKPKKYGRRNIGAKMDESTLHENFKVIKTKEPYWFNPRIVFLGEIERTNDFENKMPVGKVKNNGGFEDDYMIDDSALAIRTDTGLVVISGCSHSGICNIIEYAKKTMQTDTVRMVIGGMHLLSEEPGNELLVRTKDYFAEQKMEIVYPCHCTNLMSKLELGRVQNIGEIGSGTVVEF
jgi:7,8-dihydropterin-6-yl-methyl-4-(beta-D-ribofuranosyl)aminobenzene 5'-phosphate synthase